MKELSDRLHSIRNRNDALSRKLGVVLERQPTGEDGSSSLDGPLLE